LTIWDRSLKQRLDEHRSIERFHRTMRQEFVLPPIRLHDCYDLVTKYGEPLGLRHVSDVPADMARVSGVRALAHRTRD
jgi:hypothetical protein